MKKIIIRHWNWLISIEYPEDGSRWQDRLKRAKELVEQQDAANLRAECNGELLKIMEEDGTAFGGKLKRNIVGQWHWMDGTLEPRVRDLYYRDSWPNYRCQTYGNQTYVEVLKKDLDRPELSEELAWVREAAIKETQSGDHTGERVLHGDGRMTRAYADPMSGETTGAKAIPLVLLIPIEKWDEMGLRVCGVQWAKEDEPAIMERAAK